MKTKVNIGVKNEFTYFITITPNGYTTSIFFEVNKKNMQVVSDVKKEGKDYFSNYIELINTSCNKKFKTDFINKQGLFFDCKEAYI